MKRSLASFINSMERLDIKIIACLVLLNVYGLIMIYSASAYGCSNSATFDNDPMYLVKRQAIFVVAGFVFLFLFRLINYNWFRRFSRPIYIISLLSIFLLKTPLGVESHNATRWIQVGPVTVQIAEIVKIGMIIGLAAFITKYRDQIRYFRVVMVIWILAAIPAGLVYTVSDNLSTAIILVGIAFLLTFVLTSWWKIHMLAGGSVIAAMYCLWKYFATHLPSQEELNRMPFRYGRIAAWVSPESYPIEQGYQPLQGMYAVASGGLFGKGLGRSVQKLEKIPEAQNDMIFSIVCEELGLMGAVILIAMFVYLVYHLIRIAINSDNLFGRVLVMGIAFHIALQVLINVGVVLAVIPNTGVSLPFISYGGSAVFFTLVEMGIALSVDRIHMERSVQKKAWELEQEETKI